jgi:hypothetical protein
MNFSEGGKILLSSKFIMLQFASFAKVGVKIVKSRVDKSTERDSKIGFGLMRKLLRFDDRKSRDFGTAEIPIFELRSVYVD